MKKIKTCPNHLEIITSVFIPYKDFDFLDVPTVTRHGLLYACVQMLEHHRKDIISVIQKG